jgi:hypothetical protein
MQCERRRNLQKVFAGTVSEVVRDAPTPIDPVADPSEAAEAAG